MGGTLNKNPSGKGGVGGEMPDKGAHQRHMTVMVIFVKLAKKKRGGGGKKISMFYDS